MKQIFGVLAGQTVLYLLAVFIAWDWAWVMNLGEYSADYRLGIAFFWGIGSLVAYILYLTEFGQ